MQVEVYWLKEGVSIFKRQKTQQANKTIYRTSLVAQWLRIHLPIQGTQVRALVQEYPTCRGATKPVRHNYWACALESVPQLLCLRA